MQLLCPTCRATFQWLDSASLTCPSCAAKYEVKDGTPVVRHSGDYYHELLPKERMLELIEHAKCTDWQTALAEQISKAPEGHRTAIYTVFADESRAAFKAILPPLRSGRVLDLGCGSGAISIGLARWADEVVACDLTLERVTFLRVRLRQIGLENVRTICAGDTRPLPFPDGAFDCVVLNGVLEWSAVGDTRPVRVVQLEFLREIRRILRPDGHLYIGIENRYGYGYFFGAPEDHTDVKYAAISPRWLADMLVRRATGQAYRTYTYGYGGMRKLLADAGFRNAAFYAPIPDYRSFREIYPLERPATKVVRLYAGWRQRIKAVLDRHPRFTRSFAVVASAEAIGRSWIEEFVDDLHSRFSLHTDRRVPGIRVSATSSAGLILALGRQAIARIPLDAVNEARIRRNYEGLLHAKDIAAASNRFVVPTALISDTFNGVPFTVESFTGGETYQSLSAADQDRGDRQVFALLADGKCRRIGPAPAHCGLIWREKVVAPLRSIQGLLSSLEPPGMVAQLARLAEDADVDGIPIGFTHGDFWHGNILFNGADAPLALIDWDRWAERDLATHDFLHYLCYRRMLRTGRTWAQSLSDWLDGVNADPLELDGTHSFVNNLGLKGPWELSAALAYWIREVTGHPRSKLEMDARWLERAAQGVMPTLFKQMSSVARRAHSVL